MHQELTISVLHQPNPHCVFSATAGRLRRCSGADQNTTRERSGNSDGPFRRLMEIIQAELGSFEVLESTDQREGRC
jgi:hypothetical protein